MDEFDALEYLEERYDLASLTEEEVENIVTEIGAQLTYDQWMYLIENMRTLGLHALLNEFVSGYAPYPLRNRMASLISAIRDRIDELEVRRTSVEEDEEEDYEPPTSMDEEEEEKYTEGRRMKHAKRSKRSKRAKKRSASSKRAKKRSSRQLKKRRSNKRQEQAK